MDEVSLEQIQTNPANARAEQPRDIEAEAAAAASAVAGSVQVSEWTAELRRLADLIAAAKGTSCALVMISGTDDAYGDVAPQLILEDALRVNPYGWPQGFDIDLLNSSD